MKKAIGKIQRIDSAQSLKKEELKFIKGGDTIGGAILSTAEAVEDSR